MTKPPADAPAPELSKVTVPPTAPLHTSPDVHIAAENGVLVITLDRPKALNALTLDMIRAIDPALAAAADNPDIKCVIIEGAGDRAFCAGGDVRAVALAIGTDSGLTRDFFRAEYTLNRRIHRFPKPFIALVQGISMGGGIGLSIHGSHRVVTDGLVCAMPETGIGLFPDIGASWFLPRFPGQLGTYLALTGAKVGAADAGAVGYATQVVRAETLAEVRAALIAAAPETKEATNAVLTPFTIPAGRPPLAEHRSVIDRCFAGSSVEGILDALAKETSVFAGETLAVLLTRAPTSLKVTLREVRAGRTLEIEPALAMEYRLTQRFMAAHDFREGIRALLIDKDNKPVWQPATLGEVTEEAVDAYFAPLPEDELTF